MHETLRFTKDISALLLSKSLVWIVTINNCIFYNWNVISLLLYVLSKVIKSNTMLFTLLFQLLININRMTYSLSPIIFNLLMYFWWCDLRILGENAKASKEFWVHFGKWKSGECLLTDGCALLLLDLWSVYLFGGLCHVRVETILKRKKCQCHRTPSKSLHTGGFFEHSVLTPCYKHGYFTIISVSCVP